MKLKRRVLRDCCFWLATVDPQCSIDARSVPPRRAREAFELAKKELAGTAWWTFRQSLVEKWAETDPIEVLHYGESLRSREDRELVLSAALSEWAGRDPNAALDWVENQPPGKEKRSFLSSALRGLALADPQLALERLNELPMYQRGEIRSQILESLAESDPQTAAQMALGTTDRFSRYGLSGGDLGNVLKTWLCNDPEAVFEWFRAWSKPTPPIRQPGSKNSPKDDCEKKPARP